MKISVPSAQDRASPPPARDCFRTNSVTDYKAVDNTTLNVVVGTRDAYQLTLKPACTGIQFAKSIALESKGSQRVCTDSDATLSFSSPGGAEVCVVSAVRRLTAEEAAAARKRR